MEPANDRELGADRADADLVVAAREGDRRAFALLVERHWPLLIALCRRTLGDSWLAEDAAQEAALQAMLSLESLRRPEAFAAWLAGIGLNVSRRLLRSSRSAPTVSWDALLGGVSGPAWEVADPGSGPAEVAEAAELGQLVSTAVDSLPAGQRSAVLLFYLSGLTHQQVAATLGVEVGAVKTRLHKARRSLRRQLASIWSDVGGQAESGSRGKKGVETMGKSDSELIPVQVLDVRRVPKEGNSPTMHVVVLEELGGQRRLSIWIGESEAMALAMQMTGQHPPRPMTYVLMAALLAEIGATVKQVTVDRLLENVFYASVEIVSADGRVGKADGRPSDALNVALVAGARILVDPAVFEAVAHPITPPPFPDRDAFGPETKGAGEILSVAKAGRTFPPTALPPSP